MKTKQELLELYLRKTLPYGVYHCENGDRYLFNRDYQPLWKITPRKKVSWVKPSKFIKHFHQEYYYANKKPPWQSVKTLRVCLSVLEEFKVIDSLK